MPKQRSKNSPRQINGYLVVVETMKRKILGVFEGSPDDLRAAIKEPRAIDLYMALEITTILHPVAQQGEPLIQSAGAPRERLQGFITVNSVHPIDNAQGPLPHYICHPLAGYAMAELDPSVARTYYSIHAEKSAEGEKAIVRLKDAIEKSDAAMAAELQAISDEPAADLED